MNGANFFVPGSVVALLFFGAAPVLAQVDPGVQRGAPRAGGPLPGLTANQLTYFQVGLEDFEEAEGIGPDRAELVAEWFAEDDNRRLVEELRGLGLTMSAGEADRPVEGPLSGRQYVITGTLERWSREEAKTALEALGAKVSDSVSKKTTGVVVGESPGSKVAKAQKAGVPILDEAALAELLSG